MKKNIYKKFTKIIFISSFDLDSQLQDEKYETLRFLPIEFEHNKYNTSHQKQPPSSITRVGTNKTAGKLYFLSSGKA